MLILKIQKLADIVDSEIKKSRQEDQVFEQPPKDLDDLIEIIGAGGSQHRTLVDIFYSLK